MNIYRSFKEIYDNRKNFRETGWIYIKDDDFEDLENAQYYILTEEEDDPDDYIDTENDCVPAILYKIDKTISGLVEFPTFLAIYDNMDNLNKEFTLSEKLEALYHYVEEDTFLY